MWAVTNWKNSDRYPYTMVDSCTNQSTAVDAVCKEKDLAIWSTSDLKPALYCQRAAAKAMQVFGLIRRTFKSISVNTFSFLYKMYTPWILCTSLESLLKCNDMPLRCNLMDIIMLIQLYKLFTLSCTTPLIMQGSTFQLQINNILYQPIFH